MICRRPSAAPSSPTRLRELEAQAVGLPAVAEALRVLGADPELAWRAYAWALLAEHVEGDEA